MGIVRTSRVIVPGNLGKRVPKQISILRQRNEWTFMRRLQLSETFRSPMTKFEKLAREIGTIIYPGLRWHKDAILPFQVCSEDFPNERFEDSNMNIKYVSRKTIRPSDMKIVETKIGKKILTNVNSFL